MLWINSCNFTGLFLRFLDVRLVKRCHGDGVSLMNSRMTCCSMALPEVADLCITGPGFIRMGKWGSKAGNRDWGLYVLWLAARTKLRILEDRFVIALDSQTGSKMLVFPRFVRLTPCDVNSLTPNRDPLQGKVVQPDRQGIDGNRAVVID